MYIKDKKVICEICKKPRFINKYYFNRIMRGQLNNICLQCASKKSGLKQRGIKRNKPSWNRKYPDFWTCQECGIQFGNKGFKHKFCSQKCYWVAKKMGYRENLYKRGDKHPLWNGGHSKKDYPPEFNRFLKELIRERDGYKCQHCNVPEIEYMRKLDVHHKDQNKKNLSLYNLISLCGSCHRKLHQKMAKEYDRTTSF